MIISTSDTRKPLIMKPPVSSYLYKVIVISYSLQYDIIYEFMPVKRKNKHIERMCLSTCLADFTLLPHYTNPDRFHHTIHHIASADSCKVTTGHTLSWHPRHGEVVILRCRCLWFLPRITCFTESLEKLQPSRDYICPSGVLM